MQEIKLYTKGVQAFVKSIDSALLTDEITSDGYNVHFGEKQIDMKGAHVFTIITTTECNESNQDEAIYYSINEHKELERAQNPLIAGGEYFKYREEMQDGDGVIVGAIRDWKSPISTIKLDVDEKIEPWKLYFITISLKPFFKHQGIMGVVYGDFSENEREQLLSGEFFDPEAVLKMFPHAKVGSVDYDLDVEKWHCDVRAGKLFKNEQQFSFIRTTNIVDVEFEEYEKALDAAGDSE